MKKIYEKPVLQTEAFDVDDVITASVPTVNSGAPAMEVQIPITNLLDNLSDMLFGPTE